MLLEQLKGLLLVVFTFEILPVLHDDSLDEDGNGRKVVLGQLHPVLRVQHLKAAYLGHHILGCQRPDHVPFNVDVVRNLGVVIDAPEAGNIQVNAMIMSFMIALFLY